MIDKQSLEKLLIYISNSDKNDDSHPCDRERFADFVRTSHLKGDNKVDVVIKLGEILESNNFSEHMISKLISLYEFGRLLLS